MDILQLFARYWICVGTKKEDIWIINFMWHHLPILLCNINIVIEKNTDFRWSKRDSPHRTVHIKKKNLLRSFDRSKTHSTARASTKIFPGGKNFRESLSPSLTQTDAFSKFSKSYFWVVSYGNLVTYIDRVRLNHQT